MTVLQVYGNVSPVDYTITIWNTKVDYNLGDEQQTFDLPFESLPKTTILALKRIKRNVTVTGYVDANSSSKAGSDTARECMVDLTNLMIQNTNTTTSKPIDIRWGDSGITYSSGTSDPGTSTGCVFRGFIQKMTITEIPQGATTPDRFKILFTFVIGDAL